LRYKGYDIFTASSAQEAMEILQSQDISLIIADEHMPGVAGSELLSVAKLRHPHVIRILISGAEDMDAIKAAVNKGEVFRFFTKPWDDFELSIAVRQGIQHMVLERRNALLLDFISRRHDLLDQLEKELPDLVHDLGVIGQVAHTNSVT
jgi:DNA-binding NtrC family response regulator